ncbi:uncharacterized protein [Eurosta solidaginis]|uniref:uncharacterized protein n=1 Tax=Eurosta solidaginis TaxID=178769 RepID=UPI00353120F5
MGIQMNNDFFVNKTDIDFPDEIKWLLSLGKKFTIPTTKTNFTPINIIAEMEQFIQNIGDDKAKDAARNKLSNRILHFKRNSRHSAKEKFILQAFNKTKSFLTLHKNIVITDTGKGNKTVALYKEDYMRKMNKILEDRSTYRAMRKDPTNDLQKKNNKIVDELYKNKIIDSKEKQRLACSTAITPRIYELPKIHKPDIPLRPIISSVNVPCYNLSKTVGNILKNLVSEQYNIKNAFEFKEKLENISVKDEDILVSFDVVSLFTNIPIVLATKIILKKWEEIQKTTKITRRIFQEMLDFCLKDNNYFLWCEKLYAQTFGMPMGNPLSPTIADIVLDDLLNDAISKHKTQHNIDIKFIVKYVDDIFAIDKRKDLDAILDTFNKYHDKLKFTLETETNFRITFLDTRVHRNNNILMLDWYTKPTSSGRMINFLSAQPFTKT